MLTAVLPVTFVDIRPLELTIPNYEGLSGSVLSLPFPDASVESLSSLHVIEHIGLGRYGDPLDPFGAVKAAREIVRVICHGGRAYISVPIGRPRVQFNGQRVFAIGEVLNMFADLKLAELSVVDPTGRFVEAVDAGQVLIDDTNTGADCGLGLFEFIKDGA
jgi:SAM-dependent methyltransferase